MNRRPSTSPGYRPSSLSTADAVIATVITVTVLAAGGYAGNKIQQKTQQGDTYTSTEQRCNTVYDRKEEPAGFDVVYEYKGERHHLHTDKDPGSSLPVKDGKIVVAS